MKLSSIVVLGLGLGFAGPLRAELVNGIAAIVNGSIITYEDVLAYSARAVELYERQYGRQSPMFKQKVLEAQRASLGELLERRLILDEFRTAGYNLPESIIEDRIKEMIRERYGDRVKLIQTLQAQGKTYEQFRQEIREQIVESAMRQKNIPEVLISPHKIEAFYLQNQEQFKLPDQVKLRMIVLDKAKHGGDKTATLAQEILAKLKEGVAFAEMATLYSDGSQSAQGGDWGWVERSVLREDLRETAFSLTAGQRSEVLDKTDACFLMLVEDLRASHVKPLADVRDEVEKTLITQERARLHKKWIDRLKAKSFVRSFPEP